MKWRTAWIIIGALALVCVGLVLSVVYPFTTTEPLGVDTVDEQFPVEDADSYGFTATYTGDGKEIIRMTEIVTPDGVYYLSYGDDNSRTEMYQPGPDADIYWRFQRTEETFIEDLLEAIETDDRRELLREDRDGDGVTLIVRDTTDDMPSYMLYLVRGYLSNLGVTTYERVDVTNETIVYQPQNGWFEDGWFGGSWEDYRVTNATGEVVVDADSNTLVSVDVSWTVTSPADTYAHYLVATLSDGYRKEHEFTYEFDPDPVTIDEPHWVEEARTES